MWYVRFNMGEKSGLLYFMAQIGLVLTLYQKSLIKKGNQRYAQPQECSVFCFVFFPLNLQTTRHNLELLVSHC